MLAESALLSTSASPPLSKCLPSANFVFSIFSSFLFFQTRSARIVINENIKNLNPSPPHSRYWATSVVTSAQRHLFAETDSQQRKIRQNKKIDRELIAGNVSFAVTTLSMSMLNDDHSTFFPVFITFFGLDATKNIDNVLLILYIDIFTSFVNIFFTQIKHWRIWNM